MFVLVMFILFGIVLMIVIKNRRIIEENLGKSEEHCKALFDRVPIGLYRTTPNGEIIDANKALVEILGYPDRESLLKVNTVNQYVNPDERERILKEENEIGVISEVEVQLRKYDGSHIWVQFSSKAVKEETGKIKYYEGILRDITELKRAEEINSVLSQISEATMTSNDLDELLNVIHKLLGTIIDATNFYIALYNDNTGKYSFPYFVDEREDVRDVEPHKLPKSLTDYVRRTGKSLLANETIDRQLIKEGEVEMVGEPTSIWLGVPLKSTHGTIGVVVVQSYSDSSLYTEKDLDLLTFVSGNIALAIERKNAEEQIKKSRIQLQNLSHKLQQVREDEKEKIAYGIYEDFTQVLAVLIMDISWLQNNIPKDNEELFEKLNSMKSLADKGIKDMLRVKEELRSSQLDYIGLDAATQWYLEELQKRSGIKFKLTYKISDIELSKNLSVMLYRVFEELMNNVERHSKAKNVSIDINLKDGILEMKVKDDGIGISDDKIDDSKSIGIIGIKERIRPYNGEVIFEGEHNKGTSVTVRIPLGRIVDDSDNLKLFEEI